MVKTCQMSARADSLSWCGNRHHLLTCETSEWWFLDNSCERWRLYDNKTQTLDLCLSVCFPHPAPPAFAFPEEGERGRGRQFSRWWIPLWTVSFLAECVQWARARSWNLANETHPPEGAWSSHWLSGWQRRRWLDDGVLCALLSVQIKLSGLMTGMAHHEAAKCAEWNVYSNIQKIILSFIWWEPMS